MSRSLSVPFALALAWVVAAQCPNTPPTAFLNNTTVTGNEFNVFTQTNSTANSLFTPTAQDNIAVSSALGPITMQLTNVSGSAGLPLSIVYTAGPPVAGPQSIPGSGDVWLDFSVPFGAIADGIGLFNFGIPNPFIATPSPQFVFQLSMNLANVPGINNTCWTLQTAILDPAAFNSLRLSNAVQLEVHPGIASITPNFAGEFTPVSLSTSGGSGGVANFTRFNPANGNGGATLPVNSPSLNFSVPLGAGSGPVTYEDSTAPGYPSESDPDEMRTFLAVINPNGPTAVTGVANTLTLTTSPYSTTDKYATVTNALISATAVHTYTMTLNAGDVVTVEAFSMNVGRTTLLDGYGRTFNPGATQGADLLLNFIEIGNGLPLTYDSTGTNNFLIHGDDDSGPGFNPKLTFQARVTDSYQVLVGSVVPAAFATGDYMLNVHVITNAPSVKQFNSAGLQVNAKAAGTAIDISGNNFPAGPCTITLTPIHGLYSPVTVTATPTNATTLTFTIPNLATTNPRFLIGGHSVTVTDNASGRTSLTWDNSFFAPVGILPELLFVKSGTVSAVPTGGAAGTPNTQTYGATGTTGSPPGTIVGIPVSAGQNIYIEVLGVKVQTGTSQYSLVDSLFETGAAANGVYNPFIALYASGGNPLVATNDDDGVTPFPFAWPNGGSPGIGFNSAILVNEGGLTIPGQSWLLFIQQQLIFGTATTTRAYILNMVVI